LGQGDHWAWVDSVNIFVACFAVCCCGCGCTQTASPRTQPGYRQPAATTTNGQHPVSFGWLKPNRHFGSLSARPGLLSLVPRGVYVTALFIRWIFIACCWWKTRDRLCASPECRRQISFATDSARSGRVLSQCP